MKNLNEYISRESSHKRLFLFFIWTVVRIMKIINHVAK